MNSNNESSVKTATILKNYAKKPVDDNLNLWIWGYNTIFSIIVNQADWIFPKIFTMSDIMKLLRKPKIDNLLINISTEKFNKILNIKKEELTQKTIDNVLDGISYKFNIGGKLEKLIESNLLTKDSKTFLLFINNFYPDIINKHFNYFYKKEYINLLNIHNETPIYSYVRNCSDSDVNFPIIEILIGNNFELTRAKNNYDLCVMDILEKNIDTKQKILEYIKKIEYTFLERAFLYQNIKEITNNNKNHENRI